MARVPVPPAPAPLRRRAGLPFAAGLLGITALVPTVAARLAAAPLPDALSTLSPGVVLALSLLNPTLLLLVTAVVGAWTAHRVGLRSALAGTGPLPRGLATVQALGAGLLVAAVLHALDLAFAPWLPELQALRATSGAGSIAALLLGVLYGGLTEEVMMRWGLMALIACALHRALRGGHDAPGAAVMAAAIATSALVFGLGHLPALMASVDLTPALVARTLALNAVAGVVYGLLFWRRGLESAMLAHAATHVGFWGIAHLGG